MSTIRTITKQNFRTKNRSSLSNNRATTHENQNSKGDLITDYRSSMIIMDQIHARISEQNMHFKLNFNEYHDQSMTFAISDTSTKQ